MNASQATSKSPRHSESPPGTYFMNFRFLRLDPDYHKLLANEKVVAKQQFLATWDRVAEHMPVAAYAMTGLSTDCDLLIWRVTAHLTDLNAMSAQLHGSGLGRFLIGVRSWLGTARGRYENPRAPIGKSEAPAAVLGRSPYLVVRSVRGARPESVPDPARFPAAHLHVVDSAGFDDRDFVTAFETANPLDHRAFVAACGPAPESVTATCILAGIREIVDSFG